MATVYKGYHVTGCFINNPYRLISCCVKARTENEAYRKVEKKYGKQGDVIALSGYIPISGDGWTYDVNHHPKWY